jgi:dipeptidyl aminopeptidase/acylaminoacyl peptidase
MKRLFGVILVVAIFASIPTAMFGQGTVADFQRANGLRAKYEALPVNVAGPVTWIENSNRFWYRKSVAGGNEFVLADATSRQKQPAFDHEKLAAALSAQTRNRYTALTLPFTTFSFADNQQAIQVAIDNSQWRCTLTDYSCRRVEGTPAGGGRGARGGGAPGGALPQVRRSPDGKWEALIQNYNVAVRAAGSQALTMLSFDGSEDNYYELRSIQWSPDSKKLAAYRIIPGYRREVHYVESSPEDQLQPKTRSLVYAKPGDVLDVDQPVIFQIEPRQQHIVDRTLFPNAYEVSPLVWRKDSSAVTFEYNQRGHELYRVIEVKAADGKARAVITEQPKTFFCYSSKKYRYDIQDGKEIVWMSERDGWNHLYLYNDVTGSVSQITKGNWVVRNVIRTDEAARQIWFAASGMYPGKDPYFLHYYRINFDGTGLTTLTEADANHEATFSSDIKYYVDTYSRVNLAPVMELRQASDGKRIMELETGDFSELVKAGWKAPESFMALGRDGKTDIWGVIFRPTNFDPSKKYPVIESIYAGPHSSFVPKSFAAFDAMQAQAELGFIVVQIDGMGTSNRSKAFHDVAWKNIGDAGFPDRILWHKAVAAKYPYYDITRVGIYGGSAGGQNALGGLLFHPEFYKVAVSYAGCHDNRMDKIWWNEQWMGWPIGPQYSASSNVDNAYRLQGKLLLVVGELDTNVDPSSTMQVVNQLIKHNKEFDLLVVPGGEHGAGRRGDTAPYGEHKRFDFFVRHLLGVNPPDWQTLEAR